MIASALLSNILILPFLLLLPLLFHLAVVLLFSDLSKESMAAINGSFSPHFAIHQSASSLKQPAFGMVRLRKSLLPVKKATKLQIRSSIKDQVFEDHSTGIICYKDDRGEIICEGFDEGPRLHLQYPPTLVPLRDDDGILDRLQQRWLQIMDGETANSSDLLKKSCNGFNTLH